MCYCSKGGGGCPVTMYMLYNESSFGFLIPPMGPVIFIGLVLGCRGRGVPCTSVHYYAAITGPVVFYSRRQLKHCWRW